MIAESVIVFRGRDAVGGWRRPVKPSIALRVVLMLENVECRPK